jgi:hypothetical protein
LATNWDKLTNAAANVILKVVGSFQVRWGGASCGDVALDNIPKVNNPASEMVLLASAGMRTPQSEVELRAAKVHPSKDESAQVVRETTVANDELEIDSPRIVHRDGVMPGNDEGANDAAEFEEELETLLDKNAEVFRRLAQ